MDISDHALSTRDSVALIDSDSDSVITYGDLYQRARRVAGLLHGAGLQRGDSVALMLPNCPEFLEVSWGCQLSGLYYTPINTHLTLDEVSYIIDDSEAQAVFIEGSMAGLATELSGPHPRVRTGSR